MDIYVVVDKAIDEAFKNDRYVLNFYKVATTLKLKRHEMTEFIQSSVAVELSDLVLQLDEYIKGGRDSNHQQLREAYGNIPKPRARKIRNYLYRILEDALRYERERKIRGKGKTGDK